MGTVFAKQQNKLPSIDAIIPNEIPDKELSDIALNDNNLDQNPGTFQELHKKCKDVMPTCFSGIKVLLNNHMSGRFGVSHLLNVIDTQPNKNQILGGGGDGETSGYRFSATYVGSKQFHPASNEAFPVLCGDIDPVGNTNINVVHSFIPQLRLRYAGQFQVRPQSAMGQLSGDWIGKTFTASLTTINLTKQLQPQLLIGQYLQAITPKLAMGAEMCYNNSDSQYIPPEDRFIISYAARAQYGSMLWTGTYSKTGVLGTMYTKASESLHIGTEINVNFRTKEAVGTLGYEVDLPKHNLSFRSMVNTVGDVGSVLEKKLEPFPIRFTLSALLNHSRSQLRLGCGVVIK